MPDVVQKLDQQHVDLLVQPEFFVGDLVLADGRMWSPDTLLASGYQNVLRHPSVGTMVMPEMVGGVFDFYADAQQHIAVKPRRRRARGGFLVGQPRHPGLVQVMPWVVGDPTRPGEPFAGAPAAAGRSRPQALARLRCAAAPTRRSPARARTATWRACSGAT